MNLEKFLSALGKKKSLMAISKYVHLFWHINMTSTAANPGSFPGYWWVLPESSFSISPHTYDAPDRVTNILYQLQPVEKLNFSKWSNQHLSDERLSCYVVGTCGFPKKKLNSLQTLCI